VAISHASSRLSEERRLELDHTDPHARAMRSLVQSLAAGQSTSGLDLFRLLHKVTNTFGTLADEALRESTLSGPRWVLLLRLLAEERCGCGEGISPTHLSQRQNVSKNTISVLLRGLEEQGLIERSLVPDDRRAFQIHLTDAGRTLVEATAPAHIAFLNGAAAGLTTDESAQLIDLLQKLYRSLSSGDRNQVTGVRRQESGVKALTPDS
jgi:DNA-binding MarR family transcriptional regulator